MTELLKCFAGIEDPRIDRTKRHMLLDIIGIAVLAVICSAETWAEMEDFGRDNKKWLSSFLTLENGIPSHDTIARVFSRLNPDEFQKGFLNFTRTLAKATLGRVIAIDGKTLRRSHNHRIEQRPLHIVSAWATENQLSLGQIKVEKKRNEISAIPKLLKLIDIENAVVTIDAMGCQRDIAKQILKQGGNYVLALKGNQGVLYDKLRYLFREGDKREYDTMVFSESVTIDGDHGRIETREYTILPSMYSAKHQGVWKGLQSFVRVKATRERGDKISVEERFYISSLGYKDKKIPHAIREHWKIENTLHWSLDVIFHEDLCRVRKDHAPENLAIMRRFILSMLKAEKTFKASIRRKQRRAMTNPDYLLKVLSTALGKN